MVFYLLLLIAYRRLIVLDKIQKMKSFILPLQVNSYI